MLFTSIADELNGLLLEWEFKLLKLKSHLVSDRKNSQNRSIKQIVGHMVDSATNNTHRVIHLQYRESPVEFPNYATYGNNDKWIQIQNYQNEDWESLIQLWKYSHLHFIHVIKNSNSDKLNNECRVGKGESHP